MTGRIALALAIHNHQPVGNFGWVFEDVYGAAYEPLLRALERHPAVRLSLHYTGPLIEWLRGAHPDFLDRLGALMSFLVKDCCGGRPDLCAPLIADLSPCCPPETSARV